MLELTSQILGANPDFATLWNCRREVLQQLETQKYVVVEVPALVLPPTEVLEEQRGRGHQMQESREKLSLGIGSPLSLGVQVP